MVSSNTTAGYAAGRGDAPVPKYSTGIAKVVNSALYRHTLGAAVESRIGRIILLAGVPLVWLIMLHVGPIYQMLKISLMSHYPVLPGVESHFTLDNYAIFFMESLYFTPLIKSFIFATAATAVTLVVVYPVAYYVAKVVKPEGRSKALLLLLVPFWAGELIRTFSVIMLLANRGAVNVLLREIGLIDRPIPMLYTSFSLGFGLVYLICLYMLLPLYSAIEKIPGQYLDAAADLGAGPFTRFRRIILPLSKDGIVSGCSLVFLTCIGVFATPMLLGGPNTVLFPETISGFFHGASDKWPVGAAFALIMLVTALITAGIFMRLVGGKKRSAF
ncbi:ABC transporter permease [Aminobacter aminovorans]|uniref:Putrescine ABC transport system permease protein PotH n=1 Tax=Aminobacter aminovorans TaxID=83263 RepID=A0AAC9ARC0_AMIAI|nr:ABC transporter permease [Aminobacter aminovorans]AMS41116.1 Putrescine ABC transport system permease protein PotH [Aminobacter aminovorans]MBB3705905.1 spermidine/putrescine transport system permease protein [Aminobacter aminovorans]